MSEEEKPTKAVLVKQTGAPRPDLLVQALLEAREQQRRDSGEQKAA